MSYPRNAASPERVSIGAVVQISDGAVQSSGVAVKVIPFGGSEASGTGTVAYSADGVVLYTPVQAETNYTSFVLVASKAGCIPASTTVVTQAVTTAGTVRVGSMADNTLTAAAISADAGAELAALVETYIVNEGDATAVLQAVADKIAQDWIAGDASPIAVATAVWSVATRTITGGSLTTSPPTAAVIAAAVWDEGRAGHVTAGTFGEKVAAELDSASRLAIWNTLTTETFTADSFGELLIISDGTNGRAVKVTGANHIAADVHDCQADGLSGSTEIAAINTFATRVTTGLVQDGAVYQFTANMLELAPSGGGGSSVNVLPATGIVADRSAGATLVPVVGETISQSITLYRTDGTTAISLSGKTLVIVFETLSGVDVATVASGSITISGASSNIVTFAYPSAVTASERTLRFAIRDAAAPSTLYMQGVCSVVRAPQVDA